MYERRQSYRFSAPPGGDQAMVVGEAGRAVSAWLLDVSAGGMSLRLEGPWAPKIGQKVEVELANHDLTLAEVVRVEKDDAGATLGLRRLADDATDDADPDASVPIGTMLKHKRGPWHPASPLPLAALLLIAGLVGGFLLFRPRSAAHGPGAVKHSSSGPTSDSAAPPPITPAPKTQDHSAATAPPAAASASAPRWPVSGPSPATHAPDRSAQQAKAAAHASGEADFQHLLTKMPRTVQFKFRQLEAQAESRPRRGREHTQQQVSQIVEDVAVKLRAIYDRTGNNEAAFNEAAQPVLDGARQKIDALRQ